MRRRRIENRIILMVILIVAVTAGCCMAAYTYVLRRSINNEIDREITNGREGIRTALAEREERAGLIARLLAANPRIADSIVEGDSLSLLSILREHRGHIEIDILSVIDRDGVIISQLESPREVGNRSIKSGEPVFLNPLFRKAAMGLAPAGVELCLPDVLCIDAYSQVFSNEGGERKTIGYVRAGFMLDDDFAREIQTTSGADYILLRRKRVLAGSISPEDMSGDEIRRLSDMFTGKKDVTAGGGMRSLTLGGDPFVLVSNPVEDASGRVVGNQIVARNMTAIETMWRDAVTFAVGIAAIATVMALGVGIYTARRIFLPLRTLTGRARDIARGDYDAKIFVKQKDEIGELAGAFNDMADSLKEREKNLKEAASKLRVNQDQLIQSGRLAAVGELAAGVAHEIGNPLSAISGYAQMLRKRLEGDEKSLNFAQQIETETEFIERIIQDLLYFSRPSKHESNAPERESITDLLAAAHKTVSAHKAFSSVELQSLIPDDFPPVPCVRKEIMQVFLNLLMNAAQAMEEGGRITVEGAVRTDHVKIKIRDTGPGIPPSVKRQVFDPFFTTKPPGVGTGLGLSICFRIIEKHGGRMQIEDSLRGACFSFTLPFEPPDEPESDISAIV